ncbi:Peptidoglycan-associated lipoprotein [Neolewinella maritima]|uniref:Peptidoglycan-associated lipoprotein n=1 Tax=Neolewinella maritima TaxID=1383882 RepID=A0ABM9B2D2_9BACT|nr:OmpA family protein [Neolewinella maritima]CAH1001272.1 Peptidoglycan-associated lipoprotein [Neolewinella maritima]
MKIISKSISFLLVALMLVFAVGCNTSRAVKGGAVGGAAGGVIGGVIGKNNGSGTKGAIIGSVVGGAAGAVIGKYMDKQAEEIEEEIPGAQVDRVVGVDENGDSTTTGIVVTFDSGVLFGFGKYALTDASRIELQRMAKVFTKYPETTVTIDGHTDSVGGEASNQRLSEQRAASVADYLAELGVDRTRFVVTGHGETRPVATNDTDAGREANRRVEVSIEANEELTQKAQDGTLTVPE